MEREELARLWYDLEAILNAQRYGDDERERGVRDYIAEKARQAQECIEAALGGEP